MKLLYPPSDGYIHKVLAFAQEAGVLDRIEMVPAVPFAPDMDISDTTPLGKVPSLIIEEERAAEARRSMANSTQRRSLPPGR